jgi:hypothetical protein
VLIAVAGIAETPPRVQGWLPTMRAGAQDSGRARRAGRPLDPVALPVFMAHLAAPAAEPVRQLATNLAGALGEDRPKGEVERPFDAMPAPVLGAHLAAALREIALGRKGPSTDAAGAGSHRPPPPGVVQRPMIAQPRVPGKVWYACPI